jgi:hypothetical protein
MTEQDLHGAQVARLLMDDGSSMLIADPGFFGAVGEGAASQLTSVMR